MGSVVKGVTNLVGGIGEKIGGPIGGLLKGVADFAESPLGQLAITAGLAFFTGGSSLMAGGGLSSILGGGGLSGLLSGGGLTSALTGALGQGGAENLIGGLLQNFMGDAGAGVSGGGLSALLSLTQGQGTDSVLSTLTSLFGGQAGQAQSADAVMGQQANAQMLAAWRQAQSIIG